MAISFSGGRSRITRWEPPTMSKQLVNFITCGCESSAPFFVIYLMKVIPESILSVPGEGYSRIYFKRTWWRLFQNRFWAYLVKVIPESILSVPGEGYSRIDFKRTWWRLFQKRVVRTKFDIFGFITPLRTVILENLRKMYKIVETI